MKTFYILSIIVFLLTAPAYFGHRFAAQQIDVERPKLKLTNDILFALALIGFVSICLALVYFNLHEVNFE